MKHAFIFPGQGAQKPGMGKDFYDHFLEAKEIFQYADDILSLSLSKLIFQGPMEKLTETRYSQPAIFVVGAAILKTMEKQFSAIRPSFCGGLSLGEYTALYASGKLDFPSSLRLVAARGQFMQECCETYQGTMLVVMGLDENEIAKSEAWIANVNCPGQIVVACPEEKVDSITKNLLERGAKRVIRIPVSGAFHSPLMQEAKEKLRPLIEEKTLLTSDTRLVMNVPGDFVDKEEEIKLQLISQVVSPTRWMECISAICREGATSFFEIGPSQLLSMNRKMGISLPSIGIEKIEDLERIV